jgi:putative hydrolase of the HAD superfamily
MNTDDRVMERYLHPIAPIPTGVAPDLSGKQNYAAMLFDIYGTLLVSAVGEIGVHGPAQQGMERLQDVLRIHGINSTPEGLTERLRGAIARAHTVARGQGIEFPEVDILKIWEQVLGSKEEAWLREFALAYELSVNPVYSMPGLKALFAECCRRDLLVGLVSNAQFYTVPVLEHFLGAPLDRCGMDRRLLFFSWKEGHAKPSAVMFERAKAALLDMGISETSVLYVGNDMRNDILPAASVGFATALFAGDRRSLRLRKHDHRCKDHLPDLVITDLCQLVADA